ncbi:hypothetical protein PQU92_16705 [Asticcacaulis sp. BYS171W]|uniref:Uncharacterized protein n=1 Tax=Asticcacaulis aquaticus TaxID=2984212 RepID=A0ABT5HXX3_9CAUL|nr:hypothetical protein [Asticcacaulis aquaticus]MDC7684926.1 hypothetical protein [Asticcacaulis aquaticus]
MGLLLFSIAVLVVTCVFSFTPLAWEMSAQKHDSYPELVILFFQLPAACLLVLDAGLIVGLERRRGPSNLHGLWFAAVIKIVSLSLFALSFAGAFSANNPIMVGFANLYAILGVPMHLYLTYRGWRQRGSKTAHVHE